LKQRVVFFDEIALHGRQLKGFYANHLVLGSTLVAGNNIAFFHFIHVDF
jgi:hypothetical protein